MRAVITGGAGFLGSHLCDALIRRGDTVVCADNLSTGHLDNVEHLLGNRAFEFLDCDVAEALDVTGPVDVVAHLASPASPPEYLRRPLATLAVGSHGTENALRLAHRHQARFLLASTSEVYGDPLTHPQPEEYWGNVNPIGPRSVYDEAKRYAEALVCAYRQSLGVNTGIIRIFNTYGPRMSAADGRVVSNFVAQALAGRPLTLYGDGFQTRSFCYVDDLILGIVAMLGSAEPGPVNLGNPAEFTVAELAQLVLKLTRSPSAVEYRPLPTDDPARRCPVITKARELLGWEPATPLETGLRHTIEWFQANSGEIAKTGELT